MNVELRDKTAQRGNTVALTNAHHGDVKTVCASIKRRNSISVGTSSVIVTMKLNPNVWITFSAKVYQLFDLARRCDANSIWQPDALNPCINNGIKDSQHVYQVAAKRIFSGKTHIATGGENMLNQWYSIGKYMIDATTMTEGGQLCGCPIKEIYPKNGSIQRGLYIGLDTANMCHNTRA